MGGRGGGGGKDEREGERAEENDEENDKSREDQVQEDADIIQVEPNIQEGEVFSKGEPYTCWLPFQMIYLQGHYRYRHCLTGEYPSGM